MANRYNVSLIIYLMGNKNCELPITQTHENPAYGEFEVIQINKFKYAKIVKVIQMHNDFRKSIVSSLEKRSQLKLEGLCELHSFQVEQFPQIMEVTLLYPYYSTSLSQRKQQIFSSNQYCTIGELSKIFEMVAATLKELYKNRIRHGCINYNTILCCSDTFKITDVSSTTYMTLMELVQQGSKNQPISNKIIGMINEGTLKQRCKRQLTLEDDLFSLGMVILSLGTKIQISQFYSFSTVGQRLHIELKDSEISDYLFLLRKRYSKDLEKTVRRVIYPAKQCTQASFSRLSTQRRHNISTNRNSDFQTNLQQSNQIKLSIKIVRP